MATQYASEVKRINVEWDFLQGLLVNNQPVPCVQALRKEKSRNAARSRRGKENFEFYELAKMLPLPGAITSQLDKASIVRLTISYLRMRDFANQGDPPWGLSSGEAAVKVAGSQGRRDSISLSKEIIEQHLGGHILQSLDGFVFALSQEGKFLYISETVSIYLGLSQVELTGNSVFDYIHPGDHFEAAEQLGLKLPPESSPSASQKASYIASSSLHDASDPDPRSPLAPECDDLDRSFFIRMKSTLTKRGLHVKTSGYKVVHVTGRLRLQSFSHAHSALSRVLGLVALAHTLPPSMLGEIRIDCHMFVFRVNVDLQIVYCESRISDYMDLCPSELVGKSCYQFVHGEDAEGIRQSHQDLLKKGQVVTQYYRWLQKTAGFVWVQSCATVSVNMKNPTERHMVWVNYVISKPEYKTTPLDLCQLPAVKAGFQVARESFSTEPDFKDSYSSSETKTRSPYKAWNSDALDKDYPNSTVKERNSTSPMEETGCISEEYDSDPGEAKRNKKEDTNPTKRIKLEFPRDREAASAASSESASEEEDAITVAQPRHKLELEVKEHRRNGGLPKICTSEYPSVIQTQRSLPSNTVSMGLCIKTELPLAQPYKGGAWDYAGPREGPHIANTALIMDKPNLRHPSSSLYVSIPEAVLTPLETDSGPGPHRAPLGASPLQSALSHLHPAVSVETLSPPLSGSPCEDRAASTSFVSLGYPSEMEILQRFQASNVVLPLVHQLGGGPSGHRSVSSTLVSSQSLYTTSTIRYAPAEMTLAMQGTTVPTSYPISLVDLGSNEIKPPMELMYHHLHRLNMVPSSSSFAVSEHLFPSLAFSMAGGSTRGTVERKESHGTPRGTFS
ncbi:neuronal PAS domain-containing protein 1 [Rhinatrema bivittatum]|uniref:neuronal PAS domain-containing protein 1 n=1 Tax=Rhinatrema bivittatum TaxID=194408 RepID=UPI00112E644E|nr:neuronal PAS domain-containing protein 1 [Rhinatrema bivittatum]